MGNSQALYILKIYPSHKNYPILWCCKQFFFINQMNFLHFKPKIWALQLKHNLKNHPNLLYFKSNHISNVFILACRQPQKNNLFSSLNILYSKSFILSKLIWIYQSYVESYYYFLLK